MIVKILFGVFLLHLFDPIHCKNRKEEKIPLSIERFAQFDCATDECLEQLQEKKSLFLERFAQFHCYKHRSCTPGGEKACGHDPQAGVLAYFKDKCELHLENCNRGGVYTSVKVAVCDNKYNYTVGNIDELQFDKIIKIPSLPGITNITSNPIDQDAVGSISPDFMSSTIPAGAAGLYDNLLPMLKGLPNSHGTYRLSGVGKNRNA